MRIRTLLLAGACIAAPALAQTPNTVQPPGTAQPQQGLSAGDRDNRAHAGQRDDRQDRQGDEARERQSQAQAMPTEQRAGRQGREASEDRQRDQGLGGRTEAARQDRDRAQQDRDRDQLSTQWQAPARPPGSAVEPRTGERREAGVDLQVRERQDQAKRAPMVEERQRTIVQAPQREERERLTVQVPRGEERERAVTAAPRIEQRGRTVTAGPWIEERQRAVTAMPGGEERERVITGRAAGQVRPGMPYPPVVGQGPGEQRVGQAGPTYSGVAPAPAPYAAQTDQQAYPPPGAAPERSFRAHEEELQRQSEAARIEADRRQAMIDDQTQAFREDQRHEGWWGQQGRREAAQARREWRALEGQGWRFYASPDSPGFRAGPPNELQPAYPPPPPPPTVYGYQTEVPYVVVPPYPPAGPRRQWRAPAVDDQYWAD